MRPAVGNPEYVDAWDRYRMWARLRLVAFLGYLPFGVVVGTVGKWIDLLPIAHLCIVGWFAFVAVTSVGSGFFRCPRCRKLFFCSVYWSNPVASRCLHCGLAKWATSDPEDSASK